MNFKLFLKEKAITILLLLFSIITIEIFLMAYNVGMFIKIYIPLIIMGLYMISIIIEYFKRKKFYDNLLKMLEELDEKYLITEIIKSPNFLEGQILKNSLEQIDKSMLENVNKYKYMTEDYKEYIELWIHEIKIPIAASKMVIENNKNEVTKSIDEELNKVENYIEQALFYARSNTVEKDYYIRKVVLKEIVNESIKKNKSSLIQEKISINIHNLDIEVNTDNKWIVFILNQIIQNSIKYRKKEKSIIEIYANQGKENVILYVKDNGIGIPEEDIERIFERFYRVDKARSRSVGGTGLGLAITKHMVKALNGNIRVESELGVGSKFIIVLPFNQEFAQKAS